jgi:hypothetical protein
MLYLTACQAAQPFRVAKNDTMQQEDTQMKTRLLGSVSLLTLTLTLLWLVPFIAATASDGPVETVEQALANAAKLDALFYLTYLNATLLTLAATALYTGLYRYCKPLSPDWAAYGVIFVPVYCAFNLVAYLSQVTVVPLLVALQHRPEHQAAADVVLRLLIQQWPGSAVGVFNNLAYALLGIPSIIFGILLRKGSMSLRLAGMLLALNGGLHRWYRRRADRE